MQTTHTSDRKIVAVLTGDIVDSTNLTPEQMALVRDTLSKCFKVFKLVRGSDVEFYRGDSWQALSREPKWALRLAILAQARLTAELGVHTRVSIGIGSVADSNERKISLRTGEAFILSGGALDDIPSHFLLTGAVPERFGPIAMWFPVVLHMCNGLMSSWTRRQAELVASMLQLANPTHEAIAASLAPRVTKQSVTGILTSANWRTLSEPIKAFEATDWQSFSEVSTVETGENATSLPDKRKRLSEKSRKKGIA
jgi:hypothetical protein